MPHLEHIAIIGAGLMGHGIAQIFASQGHQVSLLDVNDEVLAKAIENIRANLTLMAQNGIGSTEDIEPSIKRIRVTRELQEAASGARFIIEAVPEKLDLKQKLFQELDSICSSDTILATNTSVISITEIATKAERRDRIVGTHFWHPPYLIPLVEVIKGQKTSSKVVDLTVDLLKSVGKHPVKVKKDVPGFIGNRLQHALWREAISIVEKDVADPETVDEVIKKGFGLRLPSLGPLENADIVGLDLTLAIQKYVFPYIEHTSEPSALLEQRVKKGNLGVKTGQGFYRWSPDKAEESKKNLLEHLLRWAREQKSKQMKERESKE
jgi:3-hydroxybutyryl-CoA dehydrogenase